LENLTHKSYYNSVYRRIGFKNFGNAVIAGDYANANDATVLAFQFEHLFAEYSSMSDLEKILELIKQIKRVKAQDFDALHARAAQIELHGFEPDKWQADLIDHVDNGLSVLACAPTSTGKTFIAFYVIEKVIRASDDDVVCVIVPTKALGNQIYAEVQSRFKKEYTTPDKHLVGIFNADDKIHVGNSQVLICVPESLEILLLSAYNQPWKNRIKYCVFDEVHFIQENVVWEYLLALIRCPFLALSATIGNPEQFVKWMNDSKQDIGRQVKLVEHKRRPRDLSYHVYNPESGATTPLNTFSLLAGNEEWRTLIKNIQPMSPSLYFKTYNRIVRTLGEDIGKKFNPEAHFKNILVITREECQAYHEFIKDALLRVPEDMEQKIQKLFRRLGKDVKYTEKHGYNDIVAGTKKLVQHMISTNRLPAIIFNFSRTGCTNMLRLLIQSNLQLLQTEEELLAAYEEAMNLKKIGKIEDYLITGIARGIAVHHAGMNNEYLKEVERLFRSKVIKLVIATGTLSHGIHMPCRTVVIAGQHGYMDILHFNQCCGRAGRRGFDSKGDIILYHVPKPGVAKLMTAPSPDICGQFKMTISFVLRMLLLVDGTKDSKDSFVMHGGNATEMVIADLMRLLSRSLLSMHTEDHQVQNKHFVRFAVEYLMRQGYIDQRGKPLGFTGLVTHLFYTEPANLLFVHLIQRTSLHTMLKPLDNEKKRISLLHVLANMFMVKQSSKDSLPELQFKREIQQFNKGISSAYTQYKTAFEEVRATLNVVGPKFDAPKFVLKSANPYLVHYFLVGNIFKTSQVTKISVTDLETDIRHFHKIVRKLYTSLRIHSGDSDILVATLKNISERFFYLQEVNAEYSYEEVMAVNK
jgi:hypothetical protein